MAAKQGCTIIIDIDSKIISVYTLKTVSYNFKSQLSIVNAKIVYYVHTDNVNSSLRIYSTALSTQSTLSNKSLGQRTLCILCPAVSWAILKVFHVRAAENNCRKWTALRLLGIELLNCRQSAQRLRLAFGKRCCHGLHIGRVIGKFH